MKILLTTESYYPNIDGGAIAQRNLALELAKYGHDVRIIAPGDSFKNKIEEDQGTKIYRVKGLKFPLYMKSTYNFAPFPFFRVRKILKEFKPDVLQVCSPYPISVCTMAWARKYNIPVVGAIHILPGNMLSAFYRLKSYEKFEKYAWKYLVFFYNLVDYATVPTKTGGDMYKKRGFKNRIRAISNGIDTLKYNPNNNGQYLKKKFNLPNKKIVLYTGRINEEKNMEVLINAIPYVLKKIDAHFLICGGGGDYRLSLMEMAKEIGVFKNTTFPGFIDWKDYPNVYDLADVFVLTGESELQSLVTLEAVASGLPVVVVDEGATHELAENDNGLVFKSKDSKQMAECIVKILSDDKLRLKMSKNSLNLVKKHSMESVVRSYEEVYRKAIEIQKKKK